MLFTSPSYSHCLGARCPHPHNPFGRDRCEACGADLVIADRFRLGERLPCSVRGRATSLTVVMDDQRPQSPRRLLKVLHQWDPRWQIQFRRESRLLTHLSRSPLTRGPSTLLSPSPFPYSSAADLIEFDPMASGISDPMGIVMDCLPGRSLGDVVDASGSLSWGQFQQLFRQLIQLVHYLHRHQIVHGDIKPDNIMIHRNQLSLVDFGAAGFVGEHSPQTSLGFCPLAIANRPLAYQRDWYALAWTCIHLLTGQHPIELIRTGADWQTVVPQLPPAFKQRMVTWMMI